MPRVREEVVDRRKRRARPVADRDEHLLAVPVRDVPGREHTRPARRAAPIDHDPTVVRQVHQDESRALVGGYQAAPDSA